MRAAAVQLNSSNDKARNLEVAGRLVAEAAGRRRRARRPAREVEPARQRRRIWTRARRRSTAARRSPPRAGGRASSASTCSPAASPSGVPGADRLSNTSCLRRPRRRADRHLPQGPHVRRRRRRASATASPSSSSPATSSSLAEAGGVEVGLSVCYDLRFPELYRILAVRGARVLTVPSAFTTATGRDHWEVLLRARAIENQAFVLAPNQFGEGAAPLRLLRALGDRRPLGRAARPGGRR